MMQGNLQTVLFLKLTALPAPSRNCVSSGMLQSPEKRVFAYLLPFHSFRVDDKIAKDRNKMIIYLADVTPYHYRF